MDSTANLPSESEAAQPLLDDDQYAKYVLQHKGEITRVMQGLIDAVAQVTMYFNAGRDMVLTSLIHCDGDTLVLDVGSSPEMNRRVLEADKLFCVTRLDKVKIQWMLHGVARTEADGRPAFVAALPDSVLRLQRREFYRLSLPIARPLAAGLRIDLPGQPGQSFEFHVADISGGGLALTGIPEDFPLDIGASLQLTRLDLPEVGLINGTLKVCSRTLVTNRLGARSLRLGCEFVKLPGAMQNLVQRYIIKIERERKARESGMA